MTNKILFTVLSFVVTLSACQKVQRTALIARGDDISTNARLRVIHAAPGLRPMNVLVNGTKINGTALSYAALSSGVPSNASLFPQQALNPNYAAVTAGIGSVSMVYPATAARPDSLYRTLPDALTAGKYYTLFITDSIARPGKSVFLNDEFGSLPDSGFYKVRFVNTMANATANVDLFSVRQGTNIATNIPYGGATNFTTYRIRGIVNGAGAFITSDTLIIRQTGTSTELARVNGFVPPNQRAFTLFARGSFTSTSGATARALTFYYNY